MEKISTKTISYGILWLVAFAISLFIRSSIINASFTVVAAMFGQFIINFISKEVDSYKEKRERENKDLEERLKEE